MVKKIGGVLAALIGAVVILALMQPESFLVSRSIEIQAAPDKIFPFVDDFSRWQAWSPWENKDASMKRVVSTPPAGKNATYAWEGNADVGKGKMTIVESTPPRQVRIQLDFTAPFEAHNVASFVFEPKGTLTHVTWTMQGPMPFMSKVVSVFVSMDSMVGKDFESGLANLKAAAEK